MPSETTKTTPIGGEKEGQDAVPSSVPTKPGPTATDECPVCHELRGSAPEGLYDHHTAFDTPYTPGDPKWQSPKCWKCGAEYS